MYTKALHILGRGHILLIALVSLLATTSTALCQMEINNDSMAIDQALQYTGFDIWDKCLQP